MVGAWFGAERTNILGRTYVFLSVLSVSPLVPNTSTHRASIGVKKGTLIHPPPPQKKILAVDLLYTTTYLAYCHRSDHHPV